MKRKGITLSIITNQIFGPGQRMFYKIASAPGEESDQPAHRTVFAGYSVGSQGFKAYLGEQRRL